MHEKEPLETKKMLLQTKNKMGDKVKEILKQNKKTKTVRKSEYLRIKQNIQLVGFPEKDKRNGMEKKFQELIHKNI